MKHVLYLLMLPLVLQNLNNAVVDPQASEFRTLIEKAPKLPLSRTDLTATSLPEWGTTMVSWVTSDRNGLIYLLQRSDKADPVIVMNRDGTIVRSWGRGM